MFSSSGLVFKVSGAKLGKAVAMVIFNQTVVGLPFTVGLYFAMRWRGCGFLPQHLPSSWRILGEIAIFVVMEEIGFYYFHRCLPLLSPPPPTPPVYIYIYIFFFYTELTSSAFGVQLKPFDRCSIFSCL